MRLFSTFKSSILPLNGSRLKIYSSIGSGFRLTNGVKVSNGTVIIGSNHYQINNDKIVKDSLKTLLKSLRPIPEILVIGKAVESAHENWEELKEEFGCSIEVLESLTAATTFNTLVDDDRSVIGVFI